jgi:hypothetical protein
MDARFEGRSSAWAAISTTALGSCANFRLIVSGARKKLKDINISQHSGVE